MLSKKLFLTLAIFVMCFVEIFGFTSYAADTSKSDSSDNKYHKVYFDDFSVSDDGRYVYTINDGYIIRYDSNKNKSKKIKKLPDDNTRGCMLMGDYLVFNLVQDYIRSSSYSPSLKSYYIYTYNLKTKELKNIANAELLGINEVKDKIYCYFPDESGWYGIQYVIDVDGSNQAKTELNLESNKSSLIKSKKRKGISVKAENTYDGSYKLVRKKTKSGSYKYVKKYNKKWKADKNRIVLKLKGKKKKILVKNAFLIQDYITIPPLESVYYLDNCIVVIYKQYSKYQYHYNFLTLGDSNEHMMIVSYDGKHKKKIY